MQDTFQWTDNSVKEYCEFLFGASAHYIQQRMEDFKSSKAPKKEWEIVAFKYSPNGNIITDKNTFGWSFAMEGDDLYSIHSVRRLSDGEVFSVGEKVKTGASNHYTIQRFSIDRDIMAVYFVESGSNDIVFISKLPQPILTTVDGVEIFDLDNFRPTVLFDDNSMSAECERGLWDNIYAKANGKLFSTREAAEKYILENRPVLSLNDVLGVFPKDHWMNKATATEKLTALVKQKLNQ